MIPLIIDSTVSTPKIIFDLKNNIFEMSGCSRPEDVRDFYNPVLKWITDLNSGITEGVKKKFAQDPLVFLFRFDYFNSSSAKFILDILMILNEIHKKDLNMIVKWQYAESDEDMREVGEELEDVIDFMFTFEEI